MEWIDLLPKLVDFLAGVLGALAVVIPLWLSVRKINPEVRNLDADTIQKYQKAINDAAAREQAHEKREDELDARIDKLEKILNSQKYEVKVVFTGGEVPHVEEASVKHVVTSTI